MTIGRGDKVSWTKDGAYRGTVVAVWLNCLVNQKRIALYDVWWNTNAVDPLRMYSEDNPLHTGYPKGELNKLPQSLRRGD